MRENNALACFLLGLGIGAATGILLAPKSGQQTRELMRSKAEEGTRFLRRRGEEILDSAGNLVDRGKSAVANERDRLAGAVEAGKQAYKEATTSAGSS